MRTTVVHKGKGGRASALVAEIPYPRKGLGEEEIRGDAEKIIYWLFSTVPGNVLDEVVRQLEHSNEVAR